MTANLLTFLVAVSEIKRVITGEEVGDSTVHLKSKKHSGICGLTIEVGDKPDIYFLATSDEQVINAWYDGINALIGK